ncbi:hypothetical protein GCM10020256_46830 [Streptomyces thermocoprophilus]
MQELMVSSHMVWQDMQASTQSCISLLIAAVPGWFMVMAPPGAAGARGGPRALPVLRLAARERHPAEPFRPRLAACRGAPVTVVVADPGIAGAGEAVETAWEASRGGRPEAVQGAAARR